MANDNHLFSVTCYNVTMQKQDYYNEFFELGQQKMNFSFFELCLPDDDPVYTLKKVMEDLDFSGLLANCSDKGRTGFNPIMMYAVVTYANIILQDCWIPLIPVLGKHKNTFGEILEEVTATVVIAVKRIFCT